MNGELGWDLVKMFVVFIDILAVYQFKEVVFLVLLYCYWIGKGSFVFIFFFDVVIVLLANQVINWLMEGYIFQFMGMQYFNIVFYGDIFYGSDGKFFVLVVGIEGQFIQFC